MPASMSPSDLTTHPYSLLNELRQRGDLSDVQYVDEGCDDGQWRARVSAYHDDFGVFEGKATALSKGLAKKAAAGTVLRRYEKLQLGRRAGSDSGYDSGEERQTDPDEECLVIPIGAPEKTKKQKKVLEKAREHLAVLADIAAARKCGQTTLVSVDVELYMGGTGTEVTEIGLAWMNDNEGVVCHHLVIKEHVALVNPGTYNQRGNFLFGESELISKDDAAFRFAALLAEMDVPGKCVFLVGHTMFNDIKWLAYLAIDLLGLLPNTLQCDLAKAFQAIRDEVDQRSLDYMEEFYGVDKVPGHNGGNDAYRHLIVGYEMTKSSLGIGRGEEDTVNAGDGS